MFDSSKSNLDVKNKLHPRNKHRFRYNFPELIESCAELSTYVFKNQYQDLSIDFKNPDAVKILNKALLLHFYKIRNWDLPNGYLCPPIPGRADYIHYVADLLSENLNLIARGKKIKVLDIGVGANCIYPLIGHQEYGWTFVGSEIDKTAIKSANSIIVGNSLTDSISIRNQKSSSLIFENVIGKNETFDLTICNPPFHASLQEATAGTQRKWKNLGKQDNTGAILNFGGKNTELWCEGGEERFLKQMIEESANTSKNCLWFTSLISKKETLNSCYKILEKVKAFDIKTINMAQGQKSSRILAWSFLSGPEKMKWKSGWK